MSALREGLTLVTPEPDFRYCFYCGKVIDTSRAQHVTFWSQLPPARGQLEHLETVISMGGLIVERDRVIVGIRMPQVGHLGCVERAKLIWENNLVVGWDCHCCSCTDDWPSMLCRNHGGAHDTNACERHRQPATTCDCGCREPAVGA